MTEQEADALAERWLRRWLSGVVQNFAESFETMLQEMVAPEEREICRAAFVRFREKLTHEATRPWRTCFPQWTENQRTGVALAGARHKEGLTQQQLAALTGIDQRHISEIENHKRFIGKVTAQKLAKALHIDYRTLL